MGDDTPEVEILGHVHLLEHIHQPIFFGDLFYAVIVTNLNDFCAFTMIYVVSAQQGNDRSLRYKDHVPPRGESDEALNRCQQGETF